MEARKSNIIAAVTVITLLLVVVVLGLFLGHSTTFFLIAGANFTVILSIFIWLFSQLYIDRRRRKLLENRLVVEGEELRIEYSFLRKVAGLPTKFRYEELEAATDHFHALIGSGGSASVFKGILYDGTEVAVKRIEGSEHGEKEFRAEVTAIASVQHVNLVRLLGYCCVSGGARLLVYEFIRNGSLDGWIFPGRRRPSIRGQREEECLSWPIRYRVAIDVAKALAYLHHHCRSRILHLDVKPENILLDEDFRAQVTDFGLSKLMGRDDSRVVTNIRGTRGYLAPEWLLENGISEKSDIYSYGMVLLELVGGRRNVCLVGEGGDCKRKWSYFPKIVNEKVREGRLMEVVDERMVKGGGVDERELGVLVNVALWCIQENASARPGMERVVELLEGRAVVDIPPETQMIVVDLLSIGEESTEGPAAVRNTTSVGRGSENGLPSTTNNSFSMSVLSGR